jgi:hypothetical protein
MIHRRDRAHSAIAVNERALYRRNSAFAQPAGLLGCWRVMQCAVQDGDGIAGEVDAVAAHGGAD